MPSLHGASSYRLYRTPVANANANNVYLVWEGSETFTTDLGACVDQTQTPLPFGSLGQRYDVPSLLSPRVLFAAEYFSTLNVDNSINPDQGCMVLVTGNDEWNGNTPLDSIEHVCIAITPSNVVDTERHAVSISKATAKHPEPGVGVAIDSTVVTQLENPLQGPAGRERVLLVGQSRTGALTANDGIIAYNVLASGEVDTADGIYSHCCHSPVWAI